jgi:hypothetical protein
MSKKLIISLDDDIEFTHVSYNATWNAVNQGVETIITPCTTFFDNFWIISKGYQVYARNKDKEICLNDMDIKLSRNAATMLLSGCFEVYPEYDN